MEYCFMNADGCNLSQKWPEKEIWIFQCKHSYLLFSFSAPDPSLDSKHFATTMGISAKNIQGMKASFFGDDLDAFEGRDDCIFWL